MKVIICGPRDFEDYELLCEAVKESGFNITEIISGAANGADSLGERWALENDIPCKKFPAKWNDLDQDGAIVKVNNWGKEYNANAGFFRNEKMAVYAGKEGGCIAIQTDGDTAGTQDMIKRAKNHNLNTFIFRKKKKDDEYAYHF